VRVVAGELGGRRLIGPPDDSVRPTGDRVREALFSILGDIEGLTVLDLFAGTGALAIEAISRGAAAATLVDTDVSAAEQNVAALGIEGRCSIVRGDAIGFLGRDRGAYDLVYCDPPYRLARRFASDLETHLTPHLDAGGRVIVETARSDAIARGMPLLDERVYGSTMIRIHGAS
jgi:16S rRNA (guanine(966)-N(2))-methyltransferase RsmD